ncbi:MAG: DUF937 domain-containing protein [Bacteroidia bacterium]
MSLISLLHGYITPELVQKISGVMGESQLNTQRAIDGVIPALVGSFVAKAANHDDATRLYEMSQEGKYDSSILGNLRAAFGGGESMTKLIAMGTPLLAYLFNGENKAATLAGNLAQSSGVKSDSANGLLALVAPIAIAVLEKVRMSKGLNVAGLINYLLGEKDEVAKVAPASLAGLLGIGNFGSLGGALAGATGAANLGLSTSGLKWLLPIVGMAIFGALVWWGKGLSDTPSSSTSTTVTPPPPTPAAAPAVNMDSVRLDSAKKAAMATNEAGAMKKKLASGVELNFAAGSIEDNLIKFIEDKAKAVDKTTWFDFDNLLFDTGKATLQAGASTQLNNVGEILKAFPEVAIKIGGYTDNVGNPKNNQKLSNDRANTVKTELEKMGIKTERLAAEGYGDTNPVASNDTEEGRAKNRRISVRVTKK